MESLAAVVAGIYIFLIAMSATNLVLAVLYSLGKLRFTWPWLVNSFVGLLTLWAVFTAWALAIPTALSLVFATLLLFWGKKKRAS